MTTRDTLQAYFSSLAEQKDWPSFLADDLTFTSFASPLKQVIGRAPYPESTKRSYSMITALKVKDLVIDGERACALTHYDLQPPSGQSFGSDVAEVFAVRAHVKARACGRARGEATPRSGGPTPA